MKLLRLMKIVADAWNLGGKLRRKTFAENCCGKLLRKTIAENFCGIQNQCAWQYTIELRRTLKSPRLVKSLRQQNCRAYQNLCGKVLRPLTIWARQNLQLLTSSKPGWRALIQILADSVACRTCRPQVIWRLRPLCFYGRRLSRTVPACCTGTTCQNFCGCQILCARENFHHFLGKIKNSISASKCPITAPKICT